MRIIAGHIFFVNGREFKVVGKYVVGKEMRDYGYDIVEVVKGIEKNKVFRLKEQVEKYLIDGKRNYL